MAFREAYEMIKFLGGAMFGTVGIQTDQIAESSGAAGVTVDGVLLKDSQVSTDQINEKTSASGVTVDGVLLKDAAVNADTINEKTSGAGVTIDGMLLKDGLSMKSTTFGIFAATGVPSGATINGITVPTVSLVFRTNPSDADTVLYVTHNGGTNWTPVRATAG